MKPIVFARCVLGHRQTNHAVDYSVTNFVRDNVKVEAVRTILSSMLVCAACFQKSPPDMRIVQAG